jgi:hypothetical protein
MKIVFVRQFGVAEIGRVLVLSKKLAKKLIQQNYAIRLLN